MRTVSQLLEDKPQQVIAVGPDDTVLHAVRTMAEHTIGAVLVMEGGRVVGILSERDYARKIILQGRASASTLVREIMSSPVLSVGPDATVDACMQTMTDKRIRHLPVMEGERLLGLISIGDLVKAVIEEQRAHIEHLERFIAG